MKIAIGRQADKNSGSLVTGTLLSEDQIFFCNALLLWLCSSRLLASILG